MARPYQTVAKVRNCLFQPGLRSGLAEKSEFFLRLRGGPLEQINFKTLAPALPAQVNFAYACAAASRAKALLA